MAVLIQQVVPADYAFVIHTVNPSNGNRDELFAEVVLGLGETLVGNYPGRALSFVWNKNTGRAFPAFLSEQERRPLRRWVDFPLRFQRRGPGRLCRGRPL